MGSDTYYTISVDTGGTFTDLVLANRTEVRGLFKAATTPDDLMVGVRNALTLAAEAEGLGLKELLRRTAEFIYSTTQSTNAIVQDKLARTAFLTTRGNRDILLYREGGKDQPHNLSIPYPKPYVPRRFTFEINERIIADGTVVVPLDEAQVRATLGRLEELEVEAVAVCFLWSVTNPLHELRVGQMLAEALPDVAFSLSHRVNGIVREYRRASATAIDASIKPLMREHLRTFDDSLREMGFQGKPLMVSHVAGGVLSLDEMCETPLHTVDSGPALAPNAGLVYAASEPENRHQHILVVDSGGTSFDVSLGHAGRVVYTREKWIGKRWYGHMTGLPAVDTQSLGAGGGSIAYVDAGGLLRVGPKSAGADPGPVSYGRGGTEPTVTDAALVLGYLDPYNFLGGRMPLQPEPAREAIMRQVGRHLGLTPEGAAEAILTVASENMRGFIVDITVAQGRDPRECIIVAGGGAAGLNIGGIARQLSVEQVIIPRLAAGLSATGGQFADISAHFSRGHYTHSAHFDLEGVNRTLAGLRSDMEAFFERTEAVEGRRVRRFICEARYAEQMWEIDVDMGERDQFTDDDDVSWLRERFDEAHLSLFAMNDPQAAIEIITWRAEARVKRDQPALAIERGEGNGNGRATPERGIRPCFFDGEAVDVDVYDGERLLPGTHIAGPAILEESTTTIVVPPHCRCVVRPTHYLVHAFVTADRNTRVARLSARERT